MSPLQWLLLNFCIILTCGIACGYLPAKPTPKLEWSEYYEPPADKASKRRANKGAIHPAPTKKGYLPVKSRLDLGDVYDLDEEKRMYPSPVEQDNPVPNYSYDNFIGDSGTGMDVKRFGFKMPWKFRKNMKP